MEKLSRRSLGQAFGLGTLSTLATSALADASVPDLASAEGRLEAWLKIYLSTARTRVWYWYSGVIDASVPGGPVLPMVGVDTLIRRDVVPIAPARYQVEMFEGSYFHALDDAAPLDRWTNPLNDREVQPFHYREGPYRFGYDIRGAFDPKTGLPYPGAPPFVNRLSRAGDQIWFSRDNYIDVPHPLPMAEWPMESSGARQTVGSFATHWGSYAEVIDPRVSTGRSAFHYEAFMDWLPWMLMAQAPGRMVWRGAGAKLGSIADLAPRARAGFMKTHPRLFDETPWTDFANMAIDYRRLRKPAPR